MNIAVMCLVVVALVYVVALSSDVVGVCLSILRVSSGRRRGEVENRRFLPRFTVLGRSLDLALSAMTLGMSEIGFGKNLVGGFRLPEAPGIDCLPGIDGQSTESYCGLCVKTLQQRVGGVLCAIILDENGQEKNRYFLSRGFGVRFREHLFNYFAPWFTYKKESVFGSFNCTDSESIFGDFSLFAVRSFQAVALNWSENGKERQGVLWIGYDKTLSNGYGVPEYLQVLALRMSMAIASSSTVSLLSEKMSRAENSNRQKSEFIAHISHDIRSPVANIKSILGLLLSHGWKEGESRELVEAGIKNCEGLGQIVESLIDYSRHQNGCLVATKSLVSLSLLVRDVMASFILAARSKGLGLVASLPDEEEPCFVLADQRQLRRIVTNLISNAIKYTERGSVTVTVETSDGGTWAVRVRDTGVGMSHDQLRRLFMPFERFAGNEIEGLGLGLALSRVLAGLNDGKIEVRSTARVGSEFVFSMPVAIVDEMKRPPPVRDLVTSPVAATSLIQKELSSQAALPLLGIRILVVDDEVDCAESLARALRTFGAETLTCVKVSEALGVLNLDRPDVILSDVGMPDGGARKVLEFLAKRALGIPLIVFSGDEEQGQALLSRGAKGVLLKGGDLTELKDKVLEVLSDCRVKLSNAA